MLATVLVGVSEIGRTLACGSCRGFLDATVLVLHITTPEIGLLPYSFFSDL
jgi:hypothetical protein